MEQLSAYFQENPNLFGLVFSALGLLLLVGAFLNWKWVVTPNHKYSLLRNIFGPRGEMIILSVIIIAAGLVFFFLF